MRLRSVLLALLALLALGGATVADAKPKPPKKGKHAVTTLKPVKGKLKVKIGIADQKPEVFTDPLFTPLGVRYARRSVGV